MCVCLLAKQHLILPIVSPETLSSSSLFLSEISLRTANELSFPFVSKSKPFCFETACKSKWKDVGAFEENLLPNVQLEKQKQTQMNKKEVAEASSTPSARHRSFTPWCNLADVSPRWQNSGCSDEL